MAYGLYTVQYGSQEILGDSIQPPQVTRNADESLTESWVFRTYISDTTEANYITAFSAFLTNIRSHDLALVIKRRSTELVNSAGKAIYNIRLAARKIGGSNDLEVGGEYEVRVSYTLPVIQTTSDVWSQSYAYRKSVRVSESFTAARRRVISIFCIYTQQPHASTSKTAKENYVSLHAAWTAAIVAKTSGGGNMDDRLNAGAGAYDLISEQVSDMNRIDAEVAVTSVFQEIFEADSASVTDEPALVDANWSFQRKHGGRMGMSSLNYGPSASDVPVTVVCHYQASVSNSVLTGGAGGNTRWGLHEIYASKIRDILVTRARTHMELHADDWDVIRGPVTFHPTPSARQLSASLELTFLRAAPGSDGPFTGPGAGAVPALWVDFRETINVDSDYQNRYRKVLDGGQDSYDVYTPGRIVKCTVTQVATTYKAGAAEPPLLTGGWNLDRRTRLSEQMRVDIVDERSTDSKFTSEYQEALYMVTYVSMYSLVTSSGGHSVAGPRGLQLVGGGEVGPGGLEMPTGGGAGGGSLVVGSPPGSMGAILG